MKRPHLVALLIGLVVAGVITALHSVGALLGPEHAIAKLLSLPANTTKSVSDIWQYLIVFLLAGGVAWMTLSTTRRVPLGVIIAILLVELAGVAWVFSLYQVLFQPLPSILGAALGFLAPIGFLQLVEFITRGRETSESLESSESREFAAPMSRPPPKLAPVVEQQPVAPIKRTELARDSSIKTCEVTAVVCDLANKHDLAEECEPAEVVDVTEKFLAHAAETFRKAGAYIESAGGEGLVALFGFPEPDKLHAEKATRLVMTLTQAFSEATAGRLEALRNVGVHAGVSSGTMIMAPVKNNGQRGMLAVGEPVELARRFCIANRFYGSRVLLGPRTFELASKILVARPIDFLSGVDVRERHEIYEPVALALDASREQITRRDAFWNGVVLYREKRWAEAYSQFQNARGPDGEHDGPLQLYLRRLEPLALQLTDTPLE